MYSTLMVLVAPRWQRFISTFQQHSNAIGGHSGNKHGKEAGHHKMSLPKHSLDRAAVGKLPGSLFLDWRVVGQFETRP